MKKIKLSDGCVCLVDDDDLDLLSQYSWFCDRHKYVARSYRIRGKKSHQYMHRYLLNPSKQKVVDHINANGLDNQRSNLRTCTSRQNNYNLRIRNDNTSGFKGVYWFEKRNKWIAQIMTDTGKRLHLGCFTDLKEAAHIYNQFAEQLFGEFARLNDV